ncbi:MAG: polysaccharide biosynthesis/export family protein [Thermodesulfobacteriota bacterium]|nr:polysaccharide biosynthesis/export family protein [Thermodesulfobacteriota bacterium]
MFPRIMSWHLFKISWLFFLTIAFAACSTTEFSGPQVIEDSLSGGPVEDLRIRPGDEIEIKFSSHPDLSKKSTVRPDGKISLKIIDEILVAGLTTSQLDEVLAKEYLNHLKDVSLNVVVRERPGLRVYVGGEVKKPGFYLFKEKMSVLDAILTAQGFQDTGDPANVILLRKGRAKRQIAMVVDLRPVISGEQMENDIYVMPYDIISVNRTVPDTFFTGKNKFVKEPRKKDVIAKPDESLLQDARNLPPEKTQE